MTTSFTLYLCSRLWPGLRVSSMAADAFLDSAVNAAVSLALYRLGLVVIGHFRVEHIKTKSI